VAPFSVPGIELFPAAGVLGLSGIGDRPGEDGALGGELGRPGLDGRPCGGIAASGPAHKSATAKKLIERFILYLLFQ